MRLNESWRRGLILLVIFLLLVAAVFWLYAAGGWLELYTVPWEGREEAVFGVVAATATAILIGTLQWLRSKSPDKVIEEKDSDPVQPTHGETQVKHTPSVSVLAEQAEKLKVLRISLATNQRRLDELSSTYQAEHDLEKRVALQSEIQLLQTEVDAQTNEIHELTFGLEGHSPYKGLLYFSEEDERIFFGRNNLIRAILPKIVSDNGGNEESFLAVIGASGSGKSSVIRAGIVPKLRARDWPVVLINPTATPLRELSAKLCIHRAVEEAKSFEEALRNDTGVLLTFVRQSISDARRFVLVVDQFEELFTLCKNEDERTIFVNALVDFVKDDSTLLLITLRADFYGHISDYLELSELIVAHQVYVRKMTQEEIRQAVAGPAITLGYEFDDGLIDEIVRDCGISANDSEPGALPLLSHALLATWERRSGHRLTRNAYKGISHMAAKISAKQLAYPGIRFEWAGDRDVSGHGSGQTG